jgi:hypothetical protein
MNDFERMKQHFGELDDYMAGKVQEVVAARRDKNYIEVDAVVAEVREDGYPHFADKLAELGA